MACSDPEHLTTTARVRCCTYAAASCATAWPGLCVAGGIVSPRPLAPSPPSPVPRLRRSSVAHLAFSARHTCSLVTSGVSPPKPVCVDADEPHQHQHQDHVPYQSRVQPPLVAGPTHLISLDSSGSGVQDDAPDSHQSCPLASRLVKNTRKLDALALRGSANFPYWQSQTAGSCPRPRPSRPCSGGT